MPSIAFLTRALDVGGAQRQLVELALGLHRSGWAVHVITFYHAGAFASDLRTGGVEVVSLGKRGRFDVPRFLWRLIRSLRRIRPDIAHAYLEAPNALLTLVRPFIPRTRIVWGLRASDVERTHYDTLAAVVSRAAAMLSRFANLIICNSELGRAHYASLGYCSERMVVIRNGINTDRFRPDAGARTQLRRELAIPDTAKVIGCVARLDPMKDHSNFLRAAALVHETLPDIHVVCVGDGPAAYRHHLEQQARQLGIDNVLWLEGRSDIERVYNALDVAVSASAFGEGTSNAVAEAMATGLACVATDVGDARAVVGDCGIVCPPGDSKALAGAIMRCLIEPPADARRIREHIVQNFSSDLLVKRSAEHLSRLLPPPSGDALGSLRAR